MISEDRSSLVQEITNYEREFHAEAERPQRFRGFRPAEKAKGLRPGSPYTISLPEQIKLCVNRGFQRLRGNFVPPLSGIIGNVVMAVIIGSIFYNLEESTGSFYKRSVLIFFAILLNAFMSAFEVLTMWAQRPIVEKHNRYAFYHPIAEASASMICDMPNKLLTSVFFNLTLYFISNLRRTPGAFFTFYLFSFTCLVTMSMFFRMVGSLSRTLAQSMAPVAVFLLNYVIYTGFVIPTRSMHPWLRWISYIDPVSYAYESLMINETFVPAGPAYANAGADETVCATVGAGPGAAFVDGGSYLNLNYEYYYSHLWRNLGVLFVMMVLFCGIHLLATEHILAQRSKGEVLLFRRGQVPNASSKNDEEAISHAVPVTQSRSTEDTAYIPTGIQKHTAIFHWDGVNYDIMIKGKPKRLLDEADGWVKPGTLTALMGATGSGKTTLLDVLASRASVGVVAGQMLVNGHPRDSGFQRKTGYVQQQDLHLPTTTVREALSFSALLRQPNTTPKEE
ncbi:MAG: hypothetical protein M1830_006674, partial [Pleopsidium flavum]